MKIKLLSLIISCFGVFIFLTSCLGDDDEITYSDNALINSFSINNIKTVKPFETDTLTFTVTGTRYPFTIDQLSPVGRIFNRDSLPLYTDITKVVINMGISYMATHTLKDIHGEDSVAAWSSTDSLDFTNPIYFKVYAPDGITTKEYEVKLNVHKVDPDVMVWKQIENSNFANFSLTGKQKALIYNEQILVFADNDPQIRILSTPLADGKNWNELTINGLDGKGTYSSATLFNGKVYLVANNEIYSSPDATTWTKENIGAQALLGSFSNKLIGFNTESSLIYGMTDGTWEQTQNKIPEDFPVDRYNSVTAPLLSNPAIERTVVMGEMKNNSDTACVAWTMLSNEENYIGLFPSNTYACPNLVDIAMVPYDGLLYAFGGKNRDVRGEEIKAFQHFYTSKDSGKTWYTIKEKVVFPESFLGNNDPFSYVVDNDNFLWIISSGELGVWKGKINRLGF